VKPAARAGAATPGSRAPVLMQGRARVPRAAVRVSRVASEASAAGDRFATSACAKRAVDPVSRAAPAPNVRPGKFAPAVRAPHAAALTNRAAPAIPAPARRTCAGTRPSE
jgi:hypothetical protein